MNSRRNGAANHRGNDVIVREGAPQTLTAKFSYGPLDMSALTGEKVDIHIMKVMKIVFFFFSFFFQPLQQHL